AVVIGRDVSDRKRAEKETRRALSLLQSTLESTADGILVVGDGSKVLSYNQRFVDMWRIPRSVMENPDRVSLIRHVQEQLVHPEEFVRIVNSLNSQPEAESFDRLEFKDGRRFERYSIGKHVEGVAI